MPVRLYSLRYVPEDEAQELRDLLHEQQIDFYETQPGNWGISAGAFWLRDEEQLEKAKQLIEVYQQRRAESARFDYEKLKTEGRHKTFIDNVKERPLQLVFYIAAILFILYVSLKPFLSIGN